VGKKKKNFSDIQHPRFSFKNLYLEWLKDLYLISGLVAKGEQYDINAASSCGLSSCIKIKIIINHHHHPLTFASFLATSPHTGNDFT
jgi:hypothetical protein